MRCLALPLLFLATGCKAPPDAPTTLDDLCGYIFAHMVDEDPEPMEIALTNLYEWMTAPANIEATFEGYSVTRLDESAIEILDDRDHDLDELQGVAVGTEGPYSVRDIADTLILVDPLDLAPDTYESYDREFIPDREHAECFVAGDCEDLEVYNELDSNYFIISVQTTTWGQYRWIEMEKGPALVQRTWLGGPAVVSPEGIVSVDDQYYINVVMPTDSARLVAPVVEGLPYTVDLSSDGGALRLQASWIVAKILIEGMDDQALKWSIDSMQKMYENVDNWLAKH